jgi:glycosyltransferase involved in cell wall biosynthesis
MVSGAEAQRIGRALESVAGWTSEIVIVLNEDVRDGTEEIALKHGAKVFREPWKGFIGQKNSAADKATQPWLLNIDADEAVSPALMAEIAKAVENGADGPAVYKFPRCSFYCGRWIRHGDWYPDYVRRLWRKGAVKWIGREPHAALEVQGPDGRLRSDLLHYPMETINHQIEKTMKYADDFVQHCAEQKRNVTFLDLLVRPPWRFLRTYLFKLGFLDGWQGFTIAWLTSFATFLRYVKVREALMTGRDEPASPVEDTDKNA